jgi:hypothetical protein
MREASNILPAARGPDNALPADPGALASLMLLDLTDQHGAQAMALASALDYIVDERAEMAGIRCLARVLAQHVAGLSCGVEEVRAILNGGAQR